MKTGMIFLVSLCVVLVGVLSNDAAAEDLRLEGIVCIDTHGDGCAQNAINASTPGGNTGFISYADNGHRREISVWDGGLRLMTSDISSAVGTRGIDIDEEGFVGINTQTPIAPLTVNGTILMEDHAFWHTQSGYAGITAIDGELYGVDENGNITLISPHDDVTGEWIFYSKNTKTGRVVRVDMERLVRSVEALTGEKFMIEQMEEPGVQGVKPSELRMGAIK